MAQTSSSKSAAAAVLACALAAFIWLAARQDAPSRFGLYHDDTLYWSAAGAIAQGAGTVLPSLPGEPALTKYPPLYPIFLSTLWSEDPQQAVRLASASSAVFAVWALVVAFLLLRRWHGVGDLRAACCVALCVLSEPLATMSGAVLSDTLFFALAVTALLFADLENRRAWIGAALFAGFATLTRSVGVGVVAGIAASYLLARQYRIATAFCALAAPFAAAGVLAKAFAAKLADGPEGYQQTWLYYTDYVGFWRASVPDLETLAGLLKLNLLETLQAPVSLTLGAAPPGPIGMMIWIMFAAAIGTGLYRQAQHDRVRAARWALAFHVPFTMLWNYEIASRLLLLFLPLFWLGLWIELGHAGRGFLDGLKRSKPTADRAVAAVVLVLVAGGAVWWGARTARQAISPPAAPIDYSLRYAALFDWIESNTSPTDRLVAIDDAFLYIHTGRQAMWPLAVTTDLRYRASADSLERQLTLLPDVAREIGARYIVWTDNDYRFAPPVQERWEGWASRFCKVMRSQDDAIRVHDLHCATAARASVSAL